MPASIFRSRSAASSRSTTLVPPPPSPPSPALPLKSTRTSKPKLKKFWLGPSRKGAPTLKHARTAPPTPTAPVPPLAVPAQVQALVDTVTALDHQLEAATWSVLNHRGQLTASNDVRTTTGLLRHRHQELLARLRALRAGYNEAECALYLLAKIGQFSSTWGVVAADDGEAGGGPVLRDMVQVRLEQLMRYLKEDLEDVEEQMKEAERESLVRVLRPAGLELSLLFDDDS